MKVENIITNKVVDWRFVHGKIHTNTCVDTFASGRVINIASKHCMAFRVVFFDLSNCFVHFSLPCSVPEGLSAPFVSASIGQPVLIAWTTPEFPNGIILLYRVERSDRQGANLVTIGTLPGSASSLIVGDQTTTPFTEYSYRVIAENSAGAVVSAFTTFLTREAGKCMHPAQCD